MDSDINMKDAEHVDLAGHACDSSVQPESQELADSHAQHLREASDQSIHDSLNIVLKQTVADHHTPDSAHSQRACSSQISENLLWQAQRITVVSSCQSRLTNEGANIIVTDEQSSGIKPERLSPQVVATARHSRKAGDLEPALSFGDKTDVVASTVPLSRIKSLHSSACPSPLSPSPASLGTSLSTAEARRLGLPLPRRDFTSINLPLAQKKSLTFSPTRSPLSSETDLATLSSPGCTTRITPRNTLSNSHFPRHSSGLVALAARKVERQLQERALAAFPHDDRLREPVFHYIDRDDTPPTSTMASSVGSAFSSMHELEVQSWHAENWELKEIKAHHEQLHVEREQQRLKREARRRLHKNLSENPWAIPEAIPEEKCATKTIDDLIKRETKKVRAPMLGSDIKFPRSESPTPARFDVTQGPESLRKAMCYLSEQSEIHTTSENSGGLWLPRKEASVTPSSGWSRPISRNPSTAGLWGGSCVDNNSPPSGTTGLMTPRMEDDHASVPRDNIRLFKQQLPPSPPMSSSGAVAMEERDITFDVEKEFDDSFITQVFNYMSLGYPAIARDFDEELGKVTSTPLAELRKDDDLPQRACGYIRLGEDTAAMSGVTEQNCARWRALRLYIHEWARQHPKMARPKPAETGWGVAARKGSWAW